MLLAWKRATLLAIALSAIGYGLNLLKYPIAAICCFVLAAVVLFLLAVQWMLERHGRRIEGRPGETKETVRLLFEKADEAIQIFHSPQLRDGTELLDRFVRWKGEVVALMVERNCLEADIQEIRTLRKWEPHRMGGATPTYAFVREMIMETQERLRIIARRMEQRYSGSRATISSSVQT